MNQDNDPVERALADLVASLGTALGADLKAVVLFGSGAEGRLRPASDVNLIAVLSRFDRAAVERCSEALSFAEAAIRAEVMFLLEDEVAPSASAFAVKFADLQRRRRVLYGDDPFLNLVIPRDEQVRRVLQVLLNLTLRVRSSYARRSRQAHQVSQLLTEAAGPLRASAASIVELEGGQVASPREALVSLAADLGAGPSIVPALSEAREGRPLSMPEGAAIDALFDLLARMRARAAALR
jgi:predicted nucleotidyltransferase